MIDDEVRPRPPASTGLALSSVCVFVFVHELSVCLGLMAAHHRSD